MSMSQIEMENVARQEDSLSADTGDDGSALGVVVDMTMLMSFEEVQSEGEPDLIVELIDLYLEDAPRQVALMQAALAETDERELKRGAHSLKGGSANIGAGRVAALCEELERADCGDSFQQAGLLLAGVEREVERACRVLEAERQRRL